ncbi:MAG: DEDD exonuclease domain-containing protein [Brachybacterium sp.]|nr:DEDD exonuclease domain-containing protein [Brachybacterium sp.]
MTGRPTRVRQLSLDDLGTPLAESEMVVLDLETTGTDPAADAITEIGAVRVRGGEVLGEFRTFVDPQRPIPAYIASLTGISDATVAGAPRIEDALPLFLEFCRGATLVAHNARFDIGFLRASAAQIELDWPRVTVLDTLALARTAFGRHEVRNHRLATLAAHVGASTSPDHRALSDARATVDVLHAIIARFGDQGMTTLEDLEGAHRRARPVQLRKRHLAADIPSAPGVYQFLDADGAVLYVGTSGNLRSRVRTYFTAAETRRRVLDMLPRAEQVRTIVCASATEAAVRELRIIAEKKPPSNRHGLRPESATWLRLGAGREGLRGARVVHPEENGRAYIGPLRSRHDVDALRGLLHEAVLGRAAVLEQRGEAGLAAAGVHARVRRAMLEDPSEVLAHVAPRLRSLAMDGRYEEAGALRVRVETYLSAAHRATRLRALARCPLLVAARPAPAPAPQRPGWELLCVRGGRFAGTALVPGGTDPVAAARALAATSTGEADRISPLCHGYHQEAEILLGWLDGDGVRVVLTDGSWAVPPRARFDLEELQRHYTAVADQRTAAGELGIR